MGLEDLGSKQPTFADTVLPCGASDHPLKWTQVLPYKQTVSRRLGDLLSLLLFLMNA